MADIREEIELFALGKLTGSALESFQVRLKTDPEFAAEVEREIELVRAIRLAPEVDALRSQLEALEKVAERLPETTYPKRSQRIPMRMYLAAAALVLLGVATIWFMSRTPPMRPEELFAEYFHPPNAMDINRGEAHANESAQLASSPFFSMLDAAKQDYQNGNPAAALEKLSVLQSMPAAGGFTDELAYYAGLACLKSGKPEQAIGELEKIRDGYPTEKPWYIALARLRAGQIAEAKADLKKISVTKSPYAMDAAAMLEELK